MDTRKIEATFTITDWAEETYEDPAEGPKLTRITIRKTYAGALDGTGVATVLTAQGADGQGYVASERVEATFEGRSGTFVIQHGGLADAGDLSTFGRIVPGSGTGAFDGLRGEAVEDRPEVLTLVLTARG